MNIQKKFKIVDSVFFNGEIDYLLFRFTELNDSVDTFIVMESSVDFSGNQKSSYFDENLDKFEKWKDKIIYIKSDFPSELEIKNIFEESESIRRLVKVDDFRSVLKVKQLYDLKMKLDTLNLSFDDVIMISQIDEFPVIPSMDILQTHLSFEPVFFSQKDFIWSKEFIKTENHLGTLCLSYSHIVRILESIFSLLLSKKNRIPLNITPINYGYRFSYFYSIEESLNRIIADTNITDTHNLKEDIIKSRDELSYIDFENNQKVIPLKKYLGSLPKNINMLNSQKIGRDEPKKHLIVVGIDSSREIVTDGFESMSIITHTNDLSTSKDIVVSDNIKIHYIQIPSQKYYDVFVEDNTLENFQKMYFLNEIKKILISKHPLDIDIFEFYFAGKYKSYTWGEIKDNFIYDLLHN